MSLDCLFLQEDKIARYEADNKKCLHKAKNRKINLILEAKNMNIKLITLPLCNDRILSNMIRNEIRYLIGEVDELLYVCTPLNIKSNIINIVVYSIFFNAAKIAASNNLSDYLIQGIYLIQFCYFHHFRNSINDKDYIILFYDNGNIYILLILQNIILGNVLIKEYELEKTNIDTSIRSLMDRYKDYGVYEKISNIYTINTSELFLGVISNIRLNYKYLGKLNRKEIVNSIKNNGKIKIFK